MERGIGDADPARSDRGPESRFAIELLVSNQSSTAAGSLATLTSWSRNRWWRERLAMAQSGGFARALRVRGSRSGFHRIRFELFVTVCGKFTIHRSNTYRPAGNGAPLPSQISRSVAVSLTLRRTAAGGSPSSEARVPARPARRMIIELVKRTAHAISGIGEKPALLTEGGLLRALKGDPSEHRQGGPPRGRPRPLSDFYFRPTAIAYGPCSGTTCTSRKPTSPNQPRQSAPV
jgi:hypothetical protein